MCATINRKKKWYFVFQNCSDLLWEKIVLLIKKKNFFEITWTIYSNSERSEEFLKRNAFLTYSEMFLSSDKLKIKIKFKLKKIIWIEKHAEKVRKLVANNVWPKPLFWFKSDTKTKSQIGRYILPIPHFKEKIWLPNSTGYFFIIKGPLKPNLLPHTKYF